MGQKGRQFQFAPFVVESEKVKEFAHVLGFEDGIQENQDLLVPPTFLTVIDYCNDYNMYKMLDALQLDKTNVLHGEQSYTYHKDIHIGDELTGTVVLKDVTEKAEKVFYYFMTDYVNQLGEVVAVNQSTMIVSEVSE